MPELQPDSQEILVGVVSDTHGRLPPQVLQALEGASMIIHAGDFNTPNVFEQLRQANRLVAVRGNTDYHDRLRALPYTEVVQVGEVFIYVIHDLLEMEIDPRAAGFAVVIHGHLHGAQHPPAGGPARGWPCFAFAGTGCAHISSPFQSHTPLLFSRTSFPKLAEIC